MAAAFYPCIASNKDRAAQCAFCASGRTRAQDNSPVQQGGSRCQGSLGEVEEPVEWRFTRQISRAFMSVIIVLL
jgi:hypothetical protein